MVAPVYNNFVAPAITAGNLNEINTVIYGLMGDGVNPPINDSDIRTNIGLGTMAVQNANAVAITGGAITGITDLAVSDGGTGASTPAQAAVNLNVSPIGPTVRATRITSNQLFASGGQTTVLYNSVDWDTASAYNTGTGRFQPLVSGYYQISFSTLLTPTAGSIIIFNGNVFKNGVIYANFSQINTAAAATFGAAAAGGSTTVFLNGSTDYVDIRAGGNTSGAATLEVNSAVGSTFFSAVYIRP